MPAKSDLQLAIEAIQDKRGRYDALWRYYAGEQPLRYSAAKLREIFSSLNANFSENWIEVIIDTTLDRIELTSFDVPDDEPAANRINELWTTTGMDPDEDDIETSMLVTGESYAIAWPEPNGEGAEIQAFYNDPRNVHLFYQAENPKRKRFAAKLWRDDDGLYRVTLYYPDRLEYYAARSSTGIDGKAATPTTWQAFRPFGDFSGRDRDSVAPNPYGEIPVFHFKFNNRCEGMLTAGILRSQDALNKLANDMMIAAEFAALAQRVIISQADPGQLKNAPNEIWWIPAGDGVGQQASVHEFTSADLNRYLEAINHKAEHMAIISRTPKHVFFRQGGDPSGEALIAMEAPLNKKAQTIIDKRLAPTYQEMAAFLLRLDGRAIERNAVRPVFARPETVQPTTRSTITKTLTDAGAGIGAAARAAGYDNETAEEFERGDFVDGIEQ